MDSANIEKQDWYYIGGPENKPIGPVAIRDFEVMWQTSEINSQTFVWKEGMKEWLKLYQVPELKNTILEDAKVPTIEQTVLIQQAQAALFDKNNDSKTVKFNQVKPNNDKAEAVGKKKSVNDTDSNVSDSGSEDSEEGTAIEKKLQALQNKMYKGDDGMWHVYDEESKAWKVQKEEPNIQRQVENLFGAQDLENMINGMDGDDDGKGSKHKKKHKKEEESFEGLNEEQIRKLKKKQKKARRAAEKKKQQWYNARINTNLYAKGLPSDITFDEAKEFFGKAGIIRKDLHTGEEKIRIYKDDAGVPKGDCLISYEKEESIALAFELLNEREIKPGYPITVEKAQFEQKGDYVPRKKVKEDKVTLIKQKQNTEKQFSWNEDDDGEGLKIVVIKNVFRPEQVGLDDYEKFFEELKLDLMDECQKLGEVKNLEIFQSNPQGVVQVKFTRPASAEACIKVMNGRFFDGRELTCEYWDGKTDYRIVRESREEQEKRLNSFSEWVDQQE